MTGLRGALNPLRHQIDTHCRYTGTRLSRKKTADRLQLLGIDDPHLTCRYQGRRFGLTDGFGNVG